MKAITLHPTNGTVGGFGDSSLESRDRRTSTSGDAYSHSNNAQAVISGLSNIDQTVHHYELPNLAQLLYDFTNKEHDMIMRCFRIGSYQSIRELPFKLAPNQVSKMQKRKIDQNLAVREPQIQRKLFGGGLFGEFEWMPDAYDNFIIHTMEMKRTTEQLQRKVTDKPFVLGTDTFKWKYQDCFMDDATLKDFVAPFLCLNDPYEVCKEDVLRSKWIEENKILHGQFKPSQMDKSMERVTKQQLPDIVNYIKKVIMVDWAEVNFIIGTNPDSFVEIKFDQRSIDTELGLRAYMNTMLTTHEVISQFNLKKVLKYWGYRDDRHVYFMLAPPWIRFNPAHVYMSCLKIGRSNDGHEDGLGSNLTDQNNIFKVNTQFSKSSGAANASVKDPQLYSKDIEI